MATQCQHKLSTESLPPADARTEHNANYGVSCTESSSAWVCCYPSSLVFAMNFYFDQLTEKNTVFNPYIPQLTKLNYASMQ